MNNARTDAFYQQFRRWDLNLLVVLDALMMEKGNVTRAGLRLGLSQSAMSHALNRLRDMTGDPLFMKRGSHMVATERANTLSIEVASLLDQIQVKLKPPAFDAGKVEAVLRIGMPEYLEGLLLPALLEYLTKHAPGIQIHVRPIPINQLAEALNDGIIELAIAGIPLDLPDMYEHALLIQTKFVFIYNESLLHLPEPAGLADLAAASHLASNYVHNTATIIDNYFKIHGYKRNIVATAAGLTSITSIIETCPLVAIMPELLMYQQPIFSHLKIQPFFDEVSVALEMVWHRVHEFDRAHQFVRNFIVAHFQHLNALQMSNQIHQPLCR